jgi:hypothetical protein
MDFRIKFIPDLEYYQEAYSEMVKSNLLKRLEPGFAIAMIVIGVIECFYDKYGVLGYFPIIFGGLGIFELVKIYTSRRKWIMARIKGGVYGQELYLHFTESLIFHSGPFSTGNISWAGIKSIKQTDKGLILKQEIGTSIYLPKNLFENKDQIDFIMSKVLK